LLVIAISIIPMEIRRTKIIFLGTTVALSISFVIHCKAVQEERYTLQPWDRAQIVQNEFLGSEHFLDSLQIPKTAKVLVLETYDPYSSLVLLRRKGYTITTTSRENLAISFKNEFDYMAMPNNLSVTDVIRNYPEMLQLMEKIGDNGKVSIYKMSMAKTQRTILDFLGIAPATTLCKELLCNDTLQTFALNDAVAFSTSFKSFAGKSNCKGGEKLYASTEIAFAGDENSLQAVCLVKRNEETLQYSFFTLTKKHPGWQKEEQQFLLPENLEAGDEIIYYLWDIGGTTITYRNMEIILYK
jgi:hypothetical protein